MLLDSFPLLRYAVIFIWIIAFVMLSMAALGDLALLLNGAESERQHVQDRLGDILCKTAGSEAARVRPEDRPTWQQHGETY